MIRHIQHREFFDYHAPTWDQDETPEKRNALYRIIKRLKLDLHQSVLDVGCGTGILVPVIKSLAGENNQLIEADISAAMLRRNKEKWNGLYSGLHPAAVDAHDLPFRDESFEVIICFAVYPHFLEKARAISELRRVLKTGGQMIILHLMSSRLLNEMHREAGQAVAEDRLKPVEVVAGEIGAAGFQVITYEEQDDLYLIQASKIDSVQVNAGA
jgi:ubiquinone/menaquinone biosynthesis C-methylase UbiE